MKVLAITQIWPNSLEPLRGPYNVQQFVELAKHVDVEVLAAVAYVPGAKLVGKPPRPALLADLPPREVTSGLTTTYLRQLYLPRLGVPIAVPLYLGSLLAHRRLVMSADVLLGTWAYPDGCATILAAKALGKPCVVKVHGSDINFVAKMPSAHAVLRKVLPHVDAMVSVSRPLAGEIAALGVAREKIHVVQNGVDTTVFAVRDKAAARAALGLPLDKKIVLSVGRLEPHKGTLDLLDAWAQVREARKDVILALVGDGVSRPQVDARKAEWGEGLVTPGSRPFTEIARWLTACDVFTLPSWMEGTPNAVLEALASGRPAVGSDVGGIPDVLSDPRSGIVVPVRDAAALARGLLDALGRDWPAESVRACGPGSWADSAAHLLDVIRSTLARGG
jgi:teichuronic acid biosynthesis glycosyltransferase TuaC